MVVSTKSGFDKPNTEANLHISQKTSFIPLNNTMSQCNTIDQTFFSTSHSNTEKINCGISRNLRRGGDEMSQPNILSVAPYHSILTLLLGSFHSKLELPLVLDAHHLPKIKMARIK
jgi:hypothetical protein